MSYEIIADYACHTGENPLWHPDEKALYWTDIPTGRLFRYDPAGGEHAVVHRGRPVGGFTIQSDGSLLLFRDRGNIAVFRGGKIDRTILEEIPEEASTRFNDVIADPEGRVFAGTMPTADRLGRLYRVERDGSTRVVLEGVGCANGMGFTPDGAGMYFTDTPTRTIWLYDYDRATGDLSNRRPFIETPEGGGGPDGMTMDTDGGIWSARWGGSGVFHYDRAGRYVRTIALPTARITSLCFAGDKLEEAYVTSAGGADRGQHGPHAGALFRIRPGARGLPEHRSRVGEIQTQTRQAASLHEPGRGTLSRDG